MRNRIRILGYRRIATADVRAANQEKDPASRSHQARHKEKQEEREERELGEKAAEQARASGRRSVLRIGSVALVAIAVAIVGVAVATGVSDVAGSSGRRSSAQMEKEVSALLSGIPQEGDTLGQASAPITLQIFGDLESQDVRTFVVLLLPDIIRDWVRTNDVKIQYRSFMTASLHHPKVFISQQVAALAAGAQDRSWNFIETFYHEQGKEGTPYATEAYLKGIAEQVPGLNLAEWEADYGSNRLAEQVAEDENTARATGFRSTPSFAIGRTGGKLVPWTGYRLYEEPGPKGVRRALHPLSYITSKILKREIERLP
jgi:protein-disulfide isomerase